MSKTLLSLDFMVNWSTLKLLTMKQPGIRALLLLLLGTVHGLALSLEPMSLTEEIDAATVICEGTVIGRRYQRQPR